MEPVKMTYEERNEHIIKIVSFLVFAAEAKELYGGVFAEEALESYAQIMGVPVGSLKWLAAPWSYDRDGNLLDN
jgi:hypothetical protein